MNARWTRSVLKAAFECAVYFGAWWLFVGTLSVPELVLGGLAATFALLAAHLAGAHLGARFWGNVRALVQAWRLPRLVASGTWDILQVLLKDVLTAHKAESLLPRSTSRTWGRANPIRRFRRLPPPTRPSRRTSS